jgi:hypothetical protein
MLTACGALGNRSALADAKAEKYNAYVDILNFANEWFGLVMMQYFNEFGYGEEPSTDVDFSDGFHFGDFDVYAQHSSRTDLPRRLADADPNFGQADEKMHALLDTMDALMLTYFDEINSYYQNIEYEQDNFVRGRQLHTLMISHYESFLEANDEFFVAFQPIMLQFDGAELPIFEERGMDISLYSLRLVLTGREISYLFKRLNSQGIDFLNADLAEYEPLYELFISDLAALEAIYQDRDRHQAQGYTANQASQLNMFVVIANEMETAATDTLNMIKAGTTDIENEMTGKVTTGGRNVPISRFNQRLEQLIGRYNNTIS